MKNYKLLRFFANISKFIYVAIHNLIHLKTDTPNIYYTCINIFECHCIWRHPSLSELISMVFDMRLTHLDSETSFSVFDILRIYFTNNLTTQIPNFSYEIYPKLS